MASASSSSLFFAGVGHGDRRVRAGRRPSPSIRVAARRAADWLLDKEVRRKGDW